VQGSAWKTRQWAEGSRLKAGGWLLICRWLNAARALYAVTNPRLKMKPPASVGYKLEKNI
jgi:hypothetical protein